MTAPIARRNLPLGAAAPTGRSAPLTGHPPGAVGLTASFAPSVLRAAANINGLGITAARNLSDLAPLSGFDETIGPMRAPPGAPLSRLQGVDLRIIRRLPVRLVELRPDRAAENAAQSRARRQSRRGSGRRSRLRGGGARPERRAAARTGPDAESGDDADRERENWLHGETGLEKSDLRRRRRDVTARRSFEHATSFRNTRQRPNRLCSQSKRRQTQGRAQASEGAVLQQERTAVNLGEIDDDRKAEA
jgi:hypothetical protein